MEIKHSRYDNLIYHTHESIYKYLKIFFKYFIEYNPNLNILLNVIQFYI